MLDTASEQYLKRGTGNVVDSLVKTLMKLALEVSEKQRMREVKCQIIQKYIDYLRKMQVKSTALKACG